jgi:hypothetical protein
MFTRVISVATVIAVHVTQLNSEEELLTEVGMRLTLELSWQVPAGTRHFGTRHALPEGTPWRGLRGRSPPRVMRLSRTFAPAGHRGYNHRQVTPMD